MLRLGYLFTNVNMGSCGIPRERAEATVETLRRVFVECGTHNSIIGLGRSGGSQGLVTGEQYSTRINS